MVFLLQSLFGFLWFAFRFAQQGIQKMSNKSLFDCVSKLLRDNKRSFFKVGDHVEMIDNGEIKIPGYSFLSAKPDFIKGKIYEILDIGYNRLDSVKIAESKEGIHYACNLRRIRKIS